jgi:uncharacterized hydrophobic protein (TIGR00271 family)
MYIYDTETKNFMDSILNQIRQITKIDNHSDSKVTTDSIKKNIEFSGPAVWILFFSIIIASAGLNINSIPVIIGAMLISPLVGPIMGIGLSMGINDSFLLKKSLKNLGIMVVISILASTAFFLISPLALDEPIELLARTKPTLYDVIIALFGGLAGIMGTFRKEKGNIIAGVAVATALMPPLCTAGFGIATGNPGYFAGAIYLFFINSVFIALSAYMLVRYLKFPYVKEPEAILQKKLKKNLIIIIAIFVLPGIYTTYVVIKENRFSQSARQFVKENRIIGKSFIYDYSVDHSKYPSVLNISFAGEPLGMNEKKMLYQKLEEKGILRSQLNINEILSFNSDTDNEVIKNMFNIKQAEVSRKDSVINSLQKDLEDLKNKELPANKIYNEILAQYPGITSFSVARGNELNIKSGNPEEQVVLVIKWKRKITQDDVTKLERWLAVRLGINNIKVIQEN